MHLPWDGVEASLKYYRLGPLLYCSELELPELQPVAPSPDLPTVMIRAGRAPKRLSFPLGSEPDWEANATEFLLRIDGVATYYVRDGAEVLVDPAADAPELDLHSYLLGSVFAAVCHQRGLLPLHASAIGTPRGAVAFLGHSGAGKSSLVAFLAQRGHPILADDTCVVDPLAPLPRRVLPVAPWLKLWRTTLDALGERSEGLPRTFVDEDKYRFAMPADQPATALAEVIVMGHAEPGSEAETTRFEKLAPAHAIRAVLELTYQFWLIQATGQTERYFLRCGQALEGVRVYRMRRPWGFDAMEATLAALETHLAAEPF